MACFSPSKPGKLNYGQIMRDTLSAQMELEPQRLAAEAEYGPVNTALQLQQLNNLLYGTEGGSFAIPTYTPAVFQQGRKLSYGKAPKGWGGAVDKPLLQVWDKNTKSFKPAVTGAAGGLSPASSMTFDAATGAPIPGAMRSSTVQGRRGGTGKGFYGGTGGGALAGAGVGAMVAGPLGAAVGGLLGAGIGSLFNSGTPKVKIAPGEYRNDVVSYGAQPGLLSLGTLSPEEERIAQQQARAAWAARGMGGTDMAAADEVLRQFALGQDLAMKRAQLARTFMGGPQFNPESPFAGNIANANQQMAALFAQPSTISKINQGIGVVGNTLGAVGSVAKAFKAFK